MWTVSELLNAFITESFIYKLTKLQRFQMMYVISNKKHFAVLSPYFVNLVLGNKHDRNCLIVLKIYVGVSVIIHTKDTAFISVKIENL